MGLFNWTLLRSKPDPVSVSVEAAKLAYKRGYKRGLKEGAATALETHADALDAALARAEYDPQLTLMLQTLSRHCKAQAAEQQEAI